jgi:predicted enzyme related to lactoylglutathione lyase
MSETGLRGRWLWVQLLTPDLEASMQFYSSLLGWEQETYHGAGEPYRFWTANGEPICGALEQPAGARGPSAWLGYLGTADVDRTLGRVVEQGGRILRDATEIPTLGRYAVLVDPWGAAFAVYRPLSGQPPPVENPAIGEFCWHELATGDVEAALSFYGDLFGWKPGAAFDRGAGAGRLYERMGHARGGVLPLGEGADHGVWLHSIRVARLEEAVERAQGHGASLRRAPEPAPGGGRVAVCADPHGAPFALREVARR